MGHHWFRTMKFESYYIYCVRPIKLVALQPLEFLCQVWLFPVSHPIPSFIIKVVGCLIAW